MPVHAGVDADHLRSCVESLLAQTILPTEIVVVEDGPLQPAQLEILHELEQRHRRVVRVRLAANAGAGVANQAGLKAASQEWILKVDADDISLPARVERQFGVVADRRVEVCGSAMLEFVDDPARPIALRRAPETHDAIGRRIRYNNPINHPTAFYLRSAAIDAGGYPPWRYMQDYGLFARMYAAGARMMNLPEPLVLFRSGAGVIRRRQSDEIRQLEVPMQRELRDLDLISTPRMLANAMWRSGYRSLPEWCVMLINRRVLASRHEVD